MKKFIFLFFILVLFLKADIIPDVCGYFDSALSARGSCENQEGNITFEGEIVIDNNGSEYLSSCNVIIPDWVKKKVQTCKTGQCKSTHQSAKSLNINYNNPPSLVSLEENPSSSDENVTVNNNITLNEENYNKLEFAKGAKNTQVTFHKTNAPYTLKINKIENMWSVIFNDELNNLEIGTINGATYSPPVILKNEKDIENIKIKTLNLASGNEVNLSATNSIEMENFSVGRGNSKVELKSPSITINYLNLSNNGGGGVDVYLYANNINIGSLSMGQNSKLYILPYNNDENITFKSNSISASSSSKMYLSSGNYYTSSLNVPGSSNNSPIKALDSNQIVNLFINNSFVPGNNPGINSNGNGGDYGDLPAYNFRVFINGNLNTGGGGTTFNAIVYVEGNATLGSPTYIKGALSAENIIVKNNSRVIYDKPDNKKAFEFCPINKTAGIIGFFDAKDTFRNNEDRNISTKIVNKEFNLTLMSLNSQNKFLKIGDINVSIFDMQIGNRISNIIFFDTNSSKEINQSFLVTQASKNARVEFLICSDYNATTKKHKLFEYSKCKGNIFDCNTPGLHFRRCFSSDNFAIRPYEFNITNIPLKPIKAGKEFNITIKALDYNGNPALDYNETLYLNENPPSNSPYLDYNDTNASKGCIRGNLIGTNLIFKNGEANVTLDYSEVGDLNVTIKEINGSEFAKVDEKDTSYKNRIIEQNSTVITFIPSHFRIEGTYKDFNDSNFTYISNDLNMSSILDLNITAQNDKNSTTKNYNSACYAKNFDLNVSYQIPAQINNKIKKILIKEEKETNETNISLSNLIIKNFSKNYFTTDNNGTARLILYINFDKNYSNPVNEFNFTVNEINMSDEDNVTGTKYLDKNVTFRYGRIDVQNVSGYGNEVNATFSYEYWRDDEGWVVNKEHNSSIFGDVNKSNAYQNFVNNQFDVNMSMHNIVNGEENVTLRTNHALPYSTKIHLSVPSWLWYHPLAKNYKNPSLTNLDCLTHPCFNVNFQKQSRGWGGVGHNEGNYSASQRTVEINATHSRIKANKSEVKKLNW